MQARTNFTNEMFPTLSTLCANMSCDTSALNKLEIKYIGQKDDNLQMYLKSFYKK